MSVIALALASFVAEAHGGQLETLNEEFITHAARQLRLFLFAGHDTNISILVLHKYPSVLKQVCDELTTIFGPEVQPTFVAARLGNEPALVNRVPYTQAITREIMRLYLPAGAFGDGAPNVDVVNFHGTRHPTEGCVISLVHCAIHYSQRVWNSSKECLPERWLLEASYELYRQVKHSRI